jgi:phage terminase large subunit
MTTITIDPKKARKTLNKAFLPIFDSGYRNNIIVGGAASGKSFDMAIIILLKTILEDGHRWLIVRNVGRTLKHSVFDMLISVIGSWRMGDLFKIKKSDLSISYAPNGNQILFTGLDDVEKLKSIYGITDIWIEEASEITEADYNQLDLRLRGETKHKKQVFLTMNPISAQHWVKLRFFDQQEPDTLTHRSTYKDNRFLDADTIERMEGITDPYFKAVYVDGEWGVYGNIVFTNYVIDDFPFTEEDLENVCTGMDYGYAHASAVIRAGFKDGELYIFDELYGKEWTNADFIEAAKDQWGDEAYSWMITADSAEPDRIEEWNRAGYKVYPAKKGAGSLKYGIDFLCQQKLHVHPRCQNMIRELQMFKRREDKDGNVQDAFVEINDDCIAAARYATEWIWGQYHGTVSGYAADELGL